MVGLQNVTDVHKSATDNKNRREMNVCMRPAICVLALTKRCIPRVSAWPRRTRAPLPAFCQRLRIAMLHWWPFFPRVMRHYDNNLGVGTMGGEPLNFEHLGTLWHGKFSKELIIQIEIDLYYEMHFISARFSKITNLKVCYNSWSWVSTSSYPHNSHLSLFDNSTLNRLFLTK